MTMEMLCTMKYITNITIGSRSPQFKFCIITYRNISNNIYKKVNLARVLNNSRTSVLLKD